MASERIMGTYVAIPLTPERWVEVEAPFPLARSEWDQLISVLTAMRPGLVSEALATHDHEFYWVEDVDPENGRPGAVGCRSCGYLLRFSALSGVERAAVIDAIRVADRVEGEA